MGERCRFAWIFFIIFVCSLAGQTPYRFFFKISGGATGHLLLIIPYRFYYEVSATVDFVADTGTDGSTEFHYSALPDPGYMMRTTGFSGRSIILLTAHFDRDRHQPAAQQIYDVFQRQLSEYSKRVKTVYKHPFDVVFTQNHPLGFTRSAGGVHRDIYDHIELEYIGGARKFKVYFNVYKIMSSLIRVYNHSYLPPGGRRELLDIAGRQTTGGNKKTWLSSNIDLTADLNRIARNASRMAERYARLKQETEFQLTYSVVSVSDNVIEILGEARPQAIVSGDVAITYFSRSVRLDKNDLRLLEDSITIDINTPEGKGGKATVSLRRIDS